MTLLLGNPAVVLIGSLLITATCFQRVQQTIVSEKERELFLQRARILSAAILFPFLC